MPGHDGISTDSSQTNEVSPHERTPIQDYAPWPPAPLLRNALANWLQLAVGIAYALVVTPIVVGALGTEGYGVWSFLNGLTTFADLFYLGLGGALIRFAAEYRAKGNVSALRRVCSVVFTAYIFIGTLLLGASILLSIFIERILATDLHAVPDSTAALACILIGARLAALFAASVFTGMLIAHERNDLAKLVMIFFTIVRFVLITTLITQHDGLLMLALISAATGWLEMSALALLGWLASGRVRVWFTLPRWSDLRPLYGFGLLSFFIQLSSKLISYSDTTVIGLRLGASAVAVYALPLQLVEYPRYAVAALVYVLLPRLVRLQSEAAPAAAAAIFVRVARLCCFLGVFLNVSLILLGQAFLLLWVGAPFATSEARWVLTWLGLAAMCQVLSINVPLPFYQSLNQLRFPVLVMLAEAGVNLAGSVWLSPRFGTPGVAFATFIPAACITLIAVPRHLCRRLELPFALTIGRILYPSLIVAISTSGAIWSLDLLLPSSSYSTLSLKAITACTSAMATFLMTFPVEDRDLILYPLKRLRAIRMAGTP